MRETNGSAVSTASTLPDLSTSFMVGNVTSTKLTFFGSTPFSTSHLTNSTCRNAPSPGAPTFLPTKSLASLASTPVRVKAAMVSFELLFMIDAPATATRSRPPSTACRNTVEVGPPIWIELDRIAAGMLELMPISVISTSRPRRLKMPSSTPTIAEEQSEVAVQPTWILVCACAPLASIRPANVATVAMKCRMFALPAKMICIIVFYRYYLPSYIFSKNKGLWDETCNLSGQGRTAGRPGAHQ